jgi:hypothetical protein
MALCYDVHNWRKEGTKTLRFARKKGSGRAYQELVPADKLETGREATGSGYGNRA